MSASTQEPFAGNFEPEGSGRTKWIVLSVLAHVLLLAWLFSLKTPLVPSPEEQQKAAAAKAAAGDNPQAQAPPQDKMVNASPERMQEVAKEINAIQADEVKEKVKELLSTEQQLADINQQKQEDFSTLAKELSKDAPQKTADAITDVTQAQGAARQAEMEANQAAKDFAAATETAKNAQTPEDQAKAQQELGGKMQAVKAAQEKARSAQKTATDAQTTATQQLAFQGDGLATARKTQADATAAQDDANNRQDEASADIHRIPGLQHSFEHSQSTASAAQTALGMANNRLDTQKKNIDTAKAQIAALQPNAANPKNATTIGKLQDRITKGETALKTLQQKADAAAEKAKESADAVVTAKATLDAAPAKASAEQEAAMNAQQKAGDLQAKATTEITKVAQSTANSPADANPAGTQPVAAVPTVDVDSQNFAELYQTAVEAEKRIAENYKGIRAAEAAKLRQIPISEAAKSIQVAVPVRPPLDSSIASSNIQSADALKAHNAEMEKALQQMDSIVSVTRSMAFQAKGSGQPDVAVSVDSMKADAAQAAKMAELATENQQGEKTADLTEMMKQIEAGSMQAGGPQSGVEMAAPNGGAENGGPASGAAANAAANAAAEAAGSGTPAGSASTASGVPGDGGGASSGRGWAMPGQKGPPPIEDVKDSLPGRKVHGEGQGAGTKWMFVDTWYIIGPFPNQARRNIDTKFPPDSVIDLDASYPGKDDKIVHWQFKQSSHAAIHPPEEQPYAIYYAYTTLWFFQERDMWIAIGSDDFAKVWVNDMLVWASGTMLKPWRADEGFRKVHFKQGLNRILFRVENGQAGCMYSLMLNMNE